MDQSLADDHGLLPQACQRCWRRKQKCDRLMPQCSNCTNAKTHCTPRVSSIEKEDVSTQELDNSGSFMEFLKRKIQMLEAEVAVNDRRTASAASPLQERLVGNRFTTTSPLADVASDGGNRNPRSNEVEYLSLTAMSGVDLEPHPADRASFPINLMNDVLILDARNPTSFRSRPDLRFEGELVLSNEQLSGIVQNLSEITADVLMQGFDYCSVAGFLLMIEPGRRLMRDNETLASLVVTASTDVNDEVILARAVIATTSPHVLLLKSTQNSASTLASLLQHVNTHTGSELPIARHIHFLSLQAFMAQFDSSASSPWHILGLAMTKAIARGWHSAIVAEQSPDENQTCQHIFWNLYVMDRTISLLIDRPFAIDENDVTLDLPQAMSNNEDGLPWVVEAIRIWTIHYSHMLSQWRSSPTSDATQCFNDFKYWKLRYTGLVDEIESISSTLDGQNSHLVAFARKQEHQLATRGLIQVARGRTSEQDDSFPQAEFKIHVLYEVPRFVSHLSQTMNPANVVPTLFDAYDVFGAAILYVCSIHTYEPSFKLSVSDFRMLNSCTEILQRIATTFPNLAEFKEILWNFLSAVEDATSAGLNLDRVAEIVRLFRLTVGRAKVTVPRYLLEMMIACLRKGEMISIYPT